MLCVVIIFFDKVAGSYKGTRKENEFMGETQEKPPELGANSDLVRFPNPHYVVGWGTEPLHRG